MKRQIFRIVEAGLLGALCLLFSGQPQAAGNTPSRQAEPALKEMAQPRRDPFTTSELMQSESGRLSSGNTPGGRGFIPNMGVGQVPKMELKGFVDGKYPMAMLEIEGVKRVFAVRKGDEIDLRIYRIPVVIQILDVNGLSVKIRTGTINQVLVVR